MAESASEKMILNNEVTVNGEVFPAGVSIDVPKEQADDIRRIDYASSQEKLNRVRDVKNYVGQDISKRIDPRTGQIL